MPLLPGIFERIRGCIRERREIAELRRQEAERLRKENEARIAEEKRERDFLYALGNDFEDTVASMFDPAAFRLIHRTPRDDDSHGCYVSGMELPDLRFMEISTGLKFPNFLVTSAEAPVGPLSCDRSPWAALHRTS